MYEVNFSRRCFITHETQWAWKNPIISYIFQIFLSIFQYFYVCKSLLAWFETLIWSLMSNILDRFSVSTHFGMFSKSFVRNFQEFWCICSKISDWCAQVQRGKHLFQAFFMPNLILYASFIAWVWPALPLRRPKFMK